MSAAPSIWPALLAFAGVLALIPLVLWALKRLQGGLNPGTRGITLVGGLALGPRERVAVIEVEGRRFLVGVTAQSVSLIAELSAQSTASGNAPAPRAEHALAGLPSGGEPPAATLAPTAAGFADLLTRLKRP